MNAATLLTPTTTTLPQTEVWSIDPSHTQAGFSVKHLMITNVKGRFTDLSGAVTISDGGSTVDVDVEIKAASITTGDAKRDAHLRSADFLHADEYPTLHFRGARIEGNIASRFSLYGDLTIRGVTRPVTLYVLTDGKAKDPWGNERVGYTATTTINRKEFGLEWNVALEAGGVLVGDDVRITIETQLIRSAAENN
jgi:polyisoprenoid-binding protein YceI